MRPVLCFLLLLFLCPGARAQTVPGATPEERAMLKTLKAVHPRIIGTDAELERCKAMIARDPLARKWRDDLHAQAVKILDEPPVEHVLIGPRLLDKSRRALDRVYTLALMYRLEGDRRFFERARRELLTVAAFPDWNPSHFLDVAEMTHAVAIGYDWLYNDLSPEDRATLRNAIVNLGLKQSLPIYEKQTWWAVVSHNWNQVCNGGMTIGALAVADEEPDLAAKILSYAVVSVPRAMKSYAPDGGWAEGPGYWTYATDYNVYMLAALQTALGTDFGLSGAQGFDRTGLFRLYFEGPLGRTFNFADAGDRAGSAPVLFWLARRFHRPLDAWIERRAVAHPYPLDLLWFDPDGEGPDVDKIPLDAFYKGIDVVFLRGSWSDPNATFVGFKGGDNAANHSHLDLGTFVLDAQGQRWAVDLGSDDYNIPGYFGKQRYTYYRLKTEGHNTLTLDGRNQEQKAKAPIVAFGSKPAFAFAVADLTAGYGKSAKSIRRGIALMDRKNVLVQDEVELTEPADILWTMQTGAEITADGSHATLKQGSSYLHARILEPIGARFEVLPTTETSIERKNTGIHRLVVRLPEKTSSARIIVLLMPDRSETAPEVKTATSPLEAWK